MLTDCPDPREVSDFHFLQLRTLRIAKENETISSRTVNIVASSSKYGLLFIGLQGGFKVIQLEDILTLDEDKENRSIEENYPFCFVSCETPTVLAVNASQTILAVCVKNASGTFIHLYHVASFPNSEEVWQPFCSLPLSPIGTDLRDFLWNPVLESLYAFCLSDGSLHLHDCSGSSIKAVASLSGANALSVCWSPKGKQLVVGKQDGSFTQYKPTLEAVNTVMPPALEDSPISVSSICWISNTVFAVVYVASDSPYLCMVNTPKGGAATYTNFNDICLGNNSIPDQKYLFHLESSWGILICASVDSIEIAVLGDMPNWVQWDLREDGKALLPGKDGANHPVGMTVMYSAQRQIIISESESYPPMPVLFFLTDNGLLVSFNMINSKSGAPTLVSSPLPLEMKRSMENATPQVIGKSPSLQIQPPVSTAFAARQNSGGRPTTFPSAAKHQNIAPRIEADLAFPHSQQLKESSNIPGNQLFVPSSNKVETVKTNSGTESIDKSQQKINSLQFPGKENLIQTSTEHSYIAAIISEMQSFEKELQDLKNLQDSVSAISGEEDMTSLKVFALNLHNFQKDMTEIMRFLSSDIYTLKNVLLESFVMVSEACSRERRRNDHSYITMLKERALDPITAKRMQKINQHYLYLSTQLREVSDKLDQDWIHLVSAKKSGIRKNSCISSTEAVYKTFVNNQNIIHNLRLNLDGLLKKADEKKLRSTAKSGNWGNYHKRSTQEDLSKLADEFLQVKIANKEEESTVAKKLSKESQKCLRDYLKMSSVITVRPTAVYSPSQSRLLSNTVLSEDFSGSDQTQDNSDKQLSSSPASKKEICEKTGSAFEKPSNNVLPNKENSVKPVVTQSYAPICEPISPPEATPPQPINKTFTGTTVSKEIFTESNAQQQIVSTANNSSGLQVTKQKTSDHQEITPSPLSGHNNKEVSYFSLPSLTKSFFSNSSETAFSASSSSSILQTFPFSSNSKVTAPKTVTVNSSSAPLSVSGLSFGQKVDVPKPSSATVTFAAPLPVHSESSCHTEGEKQNLVQQKPPFEPLLNTTLSAAPSLSSSFKVPVNPSKQKTSLAPLPVIAPPQNKTLQDISNEKVQPNPSQSNSSVGFFFQKPTNDKPLQLGIGDNTSSSDSPSCENSSFTASSLNKIAPVDIKQQENNSAVTESQSNKPLKDSDISSSQVVLDAIERTENLTYVVSQPDENNSPVLSDSKQLPSSSGISSAKPISPPTSTVPVIVSFASVVSQPTNSSAVVTPVVTSVVSIISQSSATIAQPLSSILTTVSNQAVTSQPSLFELKSPEISSEVLKNDTSSSSFGIKSPPLFGQTASGTSFFSTPKTDVPVFSEASTVQTPSFGQSTTTASNFASPPSGFFSQAQGFGTSDEVSTSTHSDFSNQPSSFSFAKPAFGQTTGSFGLAKSFFGQNGSSSFSQSTGTASGFGSFGQNNSGNSVFGQGSFFSGLGGKPSEENASKNVFGMSSAVKSQETSNLFRNSSVTSFGAVGSNSFSGSGSFSGGGGSVAQSGFGAFQQSPPQQQQQQQQQPGGFGAAPAFGSPPTFGSPPAFGASPAFGSSPVFGQQQLQMNSTFSNFANASSPTFGSLASQTSGFGSPQASGFGSSQGFGSSPSFGSSSFGGQPSSFGSAGSPPSNSSAFTQWRN